MWHNFGGRVEGKLDSDTESGWKGAECCSTTPDFMACEGRVLIVTRRICQHNAETESAQHTAGLVSQE